MLLSAFHKRLFEDKCYVRLQRLDNMANERDAEEGHEPEQASESEDRTTTSESAQDDVKETVSHPDDQREHESLPSYSPVIKLQCNTVQLNYMAQNLLCRLKDVFEQVESDSPSMDDHKELNEILTEKQDALKKIRQQEYDSKSELQLGSILSTTLASAMSMETTSRVQQDDLFMSVGDSSETGHEGEATSSKFLVPCDHCGKEANFTCSACHGACYCSQECQRCHWALHSGKCIIPA